MVILVKSTIFNKCYCLQEENISVLNVKETISALEAVPLNLQKITCNGIYLENDSKIPNGSVLQLVFTLPGGKGGFGSMLRAIGAQIEKTTNREACRDLSGRRLRDINEEKRLKHWITKQSDREAESKKRKQEKLEKMRAQPKHQFNDPKYDKERSELPEKIGSSLEEGLKKAEENKIEANLKRKAPESASAASAVTKKPKCMWLDDLNESDLSSEEENEQKETMKLETNIVIEEEKKGKDETFLDLSVFESCEDLEALGEEKLSSWLKQIGMKSGGSLSEKAQRLFAIRSKETKKIDLAKLNKIEAS